MEYQILLSIQLEIWSWWWKKKKSNKSEKKKNCKQRSMFNTKSL